MLYTTSYKTVSVNKQNADKKWVLVDAENQIIGRLASRIAIVLRGKHKINYTPHSDCGDYVIVINAEKVSFSGNKWDKKEYVRYTGYPGGQKFTSTTELINKNPTELLRKAIKGMLPKTKLGSEIIRNLHIYTGNTHMHEAQKPVTLDLNTIK